MSKNKDMSELFTEIQGESFVL